MGVWLSGLKRATYNRLIVFTARSVGPNPTAPEPTNGNGFLGLSGGIGLASSAGYISQDALNRQGRLLSFRLA